MTGVSDAGKLLRHAAYLLERPDGIGHDVTIVCTQRAGIKDHVSYQFHGVGAADRVDELAAVLALPRPSLHQDHHDPDVMHYRSEAVRGHELVAVVAVVKRPAEVGA